jgi:phosphatidylinositol dimannoside acyltransferase
MNAGSRGSGVSESRGGSDPETSRLRNLETPWYRRFLVRGVFWRQFLRWAVINIPPWIEPAIIGFWSLFFLLWGPVRRGVMLNLRAVKPGSTALANFFRCYRVFWNFSWALDETVRFKEMRVTPDWEFDGWEHFEAMQSRDGGAIMLTAHMGSYDLGAQVFAEVSKKRIVMVRAPEADPQTREFEETRPPDGVQVEFSAESSELALDLLHALTDGSIVAIQGDRVTPGIATLPATLFGTPAEIPAGPFALAMAARAPIYPVFVVRRGRRRYRLVACEPIEVVRGADRDAAFAAATSQWTARLESVIREAWYQWFAFEPFSPELAR